MATDLRRNIETFLSLRETAEKDHRFEKPYLKTFAFEGDWINEEHARLSSKIDGNGMIDYGIEGWLLSADAAKLYELAYFSSGDILELGTYRGLSAAIMAAACEAAGRKGILLSVDLDPASPPETGRNLIGRPGAHRVHCFPVEGAQAIRDQAREKRKFGFAFVDHSHEYSHVYDACRVLHRVVERLVAISSG